MSDESPSTDDIDPPRQKNKAAAELGRRGGMKGGAARAANMSQEQRSDAARMAAEARWGRVRALGQELESGGLGHGVFVFTLEPDEVAHITQTTIAGKGGLQSLQKKLQRQLSEGSAVTFDNAGLGQLIRYITQYRDGGFQGRLRHAFERSLRDLLGF